MGSLCALLTIFFIVYVVVGVVRMNAAMESMSPGEVEGYLQTEKFGPANLEMICPHCQQQGFVRTKQVDRKKGISGAKATGAILTGGVSVLATGLSRKEQMTQAHCENCGNTWDF